MKTRVTVSIVTLKEREDSLKQLIATLLPQVNMINVYLHGYDSTPSFLTSKKITIAMGEDHGDLDKFYWMNEVTGYHFILDDDLIIPKTFIKDSLKVVKEEGIKHIYSYHGCTPYRLPIASYYHDRISYPCLGEVFENVQVKVIGTGCMFYYTDTPFIFAYKEQVPNMADIHFSLYAQEFLNKELVVVKHKEGYIKHSPIDLNNTIYAKAHNNDSIQTTIINDNPHIFQIPRILPNYPLVSIIVIISRLTTDRNVVKQCLDSLRACTYPELEIITIDNNSKLVTIGKCYNDGIAKAKGKYILFVGDDDYITSDYLFSLVRVAESNPGDVSVSSYLIMFNEKGETNPKELIPTGLWKREYLVKNPFSEYLTKYVDSDAFDRLIKQGLGTIPVPHNYGYYYRVHDNQVSGKKDIGESHKQQTNKSISPLLERIRGYISEKNDDNTVLY